MSGWWREQRQLLAQAWSLCKQRAVLLLSWWLAVTVCVPLLLVIWELLVAQLHASALPVPGVTARVLCILIMSDFFMTLLTMMLAKPGQCAPVFDHALAKSCAVFAYVLALRCVIWLAVTVGVLLLVLPGLLIAVFSSYAMVDVLQHDIKGFHVLQRVIQLWRSFRWQIIRQCVLWYALVAAVVALTVWLFETGTSVDGVAMCLMVLLAAAILMRSVQVVVSAQINQSLAGLTHDGAA